MEVDGQYFDPSIIKAILPPKDQKARSTGMFEFQQELVITLEGGREIRTVLSAEEIIKRSKEAVSVTAPASAMTVDFDQLVRITEDICKNLEKVVEHLHTLSEAAIRMALTPQ